jgi:hypothetical protein
VPTPDEVFWRIADGSECRLRSTDQGWVAECVTSDGVVLHQVRVTSTQEARRLANMWLRQRTAVRLTDSGH